MSLAVATARLLLLCGAALTLLPCLVIPAEAEPPSDLRLNDPKPTTILVRVVGHGAMVLGREVGSARVTITDVATKQILATGIQQGDAGDQNQITRTPRLMEEPHYSSRPAATFTATFDLLHPTLVDMLTDRAASPPAWTPGHRVQVRRHRACEVERPLLIVARRENTALDPNLRLCDWSRNVHE